MKLISTFIMFFCASILFSQEYEGKYYKKSEPTNAGPIVYSLELHANGLYEVKIHRRMNKEYGPDEYFTGCGDWEQVKHKIVFYPDLTGDKKEIDLTGITARFDAREKDVLVFFSNKHWANISINAGLKKID